MEGDDQPAQHGEADAKHGLAQAAHRRPLLEARGEAAEIARHVRQPSGAGGRRDHGADGHHPEAQHAQVAHEPAGRRAHGLGQIRVVDAVRGGSGRDACEQHHRQAGADDAEAEVVQRPPPVRRQGERPDRRQPRDHPGHPLDPADALADPPRLEPTQHRRGVDQERRAGCRQLAHEVLVRHLARAGEHAQRLAQLQGGAVGVAADDDAMDLLDGGAEDGLEPRRGDDAVEQVDQPAAVRDERRGPRPSMRSASSSARAWRAAADLQDDDRAIGELRAVEQRAVGPRRHDADEQRRGRPRARGPGRPSAEPGRAAARAPPASSSRCQPRGSSGGPRRQTEPRRGAATWVACGWRRPAGSSRR